MRRREFIALVGGAAVSWPFGVSAQQAKAPLQIGFLPLGSLSNAYDRSLVEAFQQGLGDAGLEDKRDFVLDIGWTTGDPEAAVSELIQRGAQLLVPCGSSRPAPDVDDTNSLHQRGQSRRDGACR